jgi:hypothetical protein
LQEIEWNVPTTEIRMSVAGERYKGNWIAQVSSSFTDNVNVGNLGLFIDDHVENMWVQSKGTQGGQ